MSTFNRIILFICFVNLSEITSNDDEANVSQYKLKNIYEGSKFPVKYLEKDSWAPTVSDFNYYIRLMQRTLEYFGRSPNETDATIAIGLYLTKSVLKRALVEGRSKLQPGQRSDLSKTINKADHILSHYIYTMLPYGWDDLEFRISKLFQCDDPLVYSISEYNKNRLNKWILGKEAINAFIEDMDEATFPKEKYIALGQAEADDYFIHIMDSDLCLSRIAYNPEPLDVSTTVPCRPDSYCEGCITSDPSIGYGLSHRMLNMFMRLNRWRCHLESEAEDLARLDQLCAAMYREAVYVARRGFFARDLFLEHIALCAMLGYEEFHRQNWFKKASSWLTEQGCMKESRNYDLNLSRLWIESAGDDLDRKQDLLRFRCNTMHALCQDHPTALLMIVFGHAIRYTTNFMDTTV